MMGRVDGYARSENGAGTLGTRVHFREIKNWWTKIFFMETKLWNSVEKTTRFLLTRARADDVYRSIDQSRRSET